MKSNNCLVLLLLVLVIGTLFWKCSQPTKSKLKYRRHTAIISPRIPRIVQNVEEELETQGPDGDFGVPIENGDIGEIIEETDPICLEAYNDIYTDCNRNPSRYARYATCDQAALCIVKSQQPIGSRCFPDQSVACP